MLKVLAPVTVGRTTIKVEDAIGEFAVSVRDHAAEAIKVMEATWGRLSAAKHAAEYQLGLLHRRYGAAASYTIQVHDLEEAKIVYETSHNRPALALVE